MNICPKTGLDFTNDLALTDDIAFFDACCSRGTDVLTQSNGEFFLHRHHFYGAILRQFLVSLRMNTTFFKCK